MTKAVKTETSISPAPRIVSVGPRAALPGGEIEVFGAHLGPAGLTQPAAFVDDLPSQVLLSRSSRMVVRVPTGGDDTGTGQLDIRLRGVRSNTVKVEVARQVADDVHAVANPAVDAAGNIFVTFSGPRGQSTPVSVFRIGTNGEARPFVTGLMNATGLGFDDAGYLYVSSRHEGTVHRVSQAGAASLYAEGMGIATGLAFDAEHNLYVGDRSGTIFKIGADRQIFVFATLEPSVAAYHLAFGPDGTLFVTGPTTSSYDCVYAIDHAGAARVYFRGLGRPQGLAVDAAGDIYVAASYRGRRGVVRVTPAEEASLVVAGSGIVGLAFAPQGEMVLATANAVFQIPWPAERRPM